MRPDGEPSFRDRIPSPRSVKRSAAALLCTVAACGDVPEVHFTHEQECLELKVGDAAKHLRDRGIPLNITDQGSDNPEILTVRAVRGYLQDRCREIEIFNFENLEDYHLTDGEAVMVEVLAITDPSPGNPD